MEEEKLDPIVEMHDVVRVENVERVVILHPKLGLFVGEFLGLALWSLMDAGGQDCVVSFATRKEAKEYARGWTSPEGQSDFKRLKFQKVRPQYMIGEHYIPFKECKRIGLEFWIPEPIPERKH